MIIAVTAGVLLGLVLIVLSAPLTQTTKYNSTIANAYLNVAMQTLDRPSFIISPTTDVSFESRVINDQFDREEIPGDPSTLLRTTRNSTVRCGRRACTFIDGEFGVSFDLRDVAVFQKLSRMDSDGILRSRDQNTGANGQIEFGTLGGIGIHQAVCRVDDAGECALDMDLSGSVREWIEGREDATGWHRVWKGVERMFAMRGSALSWLKSLVPVLALIAGLFAAYYLVGPGSLPGAPSSRDIGVGAGSLLLLGLFDDGDESGSDGENDDAESDADDALQIDNRILAGVAGALIACTTLLILALTAPSAIGTLAIAAATSVAVVGAVWIGSTAIISSLPRVIRDSIGNLWLTLALNGLDDPILYQTASGTLELRESSDIGLDGSGPRYRIGNNLVGFAVDRSVESFGDAGIRGSKLGTLRSAEQQLNAITDGGGPAIDVGVEYEITDEVKNGGVYGVIPTRDSMDADKRSGTYVPTDKWMSRMADAATGKISERAQLEATKEFADGESGFSDQQLMYLSLGAAIAGFIGGAGLWAVLL